MILALLMLAAPLALTVSTEGHVFIDGDSSVHRWTCEAHDFSGTAEADGDATTVANLQHIEATVPVGRITCGHDEMDEKLRDALKSVAFPLIRYRLTKASALPDVGGVHRFSAVGELEVAGRSRTITAVVSVTQEGGRLHAETSVPLLLSDFDIAPPTAFFGAMKTHNEIVVRINVPLAARGARP